MMVLVERSDDPALASLTEEEDPAREENRRCVENHETSGKDLFNPWSSTHIL